jgi:hypothetical protein
MTDQTAATCTARIVNEHIGGEHRCVLEIGHREPEFGTDHAGPVDNDGVRYRWSDDAIGAVTHDARTAPAVQAPATDRAAAPADWVDGHPQLEAIAAAVWERCGRSDSGMCVEDDPRNIAVAALAAVLPAPVDRASVTAAELAHALDNSTPYPIELDRALCDFMAARLLEMLTVLKRPEHAVWQPEDEPEPGEQPQPEDPETLAQPATED